MLHESGHLAGPILYIKLQGRLETIRISMSTSIPLRNVDYACYVLYIKRH